MKSVPAIAVVGCGNFARRQHLPNLAGWDGARLKAVCDSDAATARACAARFHAREAHASLDPVLEDPEIDGVVIAVPDRFQAETVRRVLEAGKQVYVEKPVASGDAEFRQLIAARDKSGCRVAVGFNKRFAPAYVQAHQWIGEQGGVHNLYLRMADDAWRWATKLPPGSLLRHDACHHFDLAHWLTGSRIVSVDAGGARPDELAMILKHANGLTTLVLLSGHATMDLPKERMEAITERGAVTMDDYVETRRFGADGEPVARTFPGLATLPEDQHWVERLGDRGLEGMLDIRRAILLEWRRSGLSDPPAIPNFLRDQGWRAAIRGFVTAIAEDRPLPHAGLEDAWMAARITAAAETGTGTSLAPPACD